MITTFLDLVSTGAAIGLVSTLTAVGIAVLPWSSVGSDQMVDAADSALRLAALWLANPFVSEHADRPRNRVIVVS